MFKRLKPQGQKIQIFFDNQEIEAFEGENLAAALLAAGIKQLRKNPVSKQPRAPYCMMGACFECLVEIDGQSKQACMTETTAGLTVRTPQDIDEAGNE